MLGIKSHKISVTKDAHLAVKTYCAVKGINAKDFVSRLILQTVGSTYLNLKSKMVPEFDQELKSNENISLEDSDFSRQKYYQTMLELEEIISSYKTRSLNDQLSKDKLLNLYCFKLPKVDMSYKELFNNSNTEKIVDQFTVLNNFSRISPLTSDFGLFSAITTNSPTHMDFMDLFNTENQFEHPYYKAGTIAYIVFNLIANDPSKAQTPEEISKLSSSISKSKVQTALYWLLDKDLIQRKLRENPKDKRKNSWEYWKVETPDNLVRRGITVDELLKSLPLHEDQAISIGELAINLNIPPSTIRDILRRVERTGQVRSIQGTNHKNQMANRYYRLVPEHPVPMGCADKQMVSFR